MKKKLIFGCGLFVAALLICLMGAYQFPAPTPALGPWTQSGNPLQVSGTFSLSPSGSSSLVLSGGTVTTTNPPVPYSVQGSGALTLAGTGSTSTLPNQTCSQVVLSVSTSSASLLSSGGTSGLNLPVGTVLTLSATNLNTLKVSGSGATIGYLYSQ